MSDRATHGGRKGHRKSRRMGKIVRRSIDDARQMMHPGPFRITDPPEWVAISEKVLIGQEAMSAPKPPRKTLDADARHLLRTIAAVATALWRVRAKLASEPGAQMPPKLRHLPRHVEAAWDALAAGGFEVNDHVGQKYDPGMAVNPVTYSPDSSVKPNTIIEALKPTLFWRDILVQRADVILACPADEPPDRPDQAHSAQSSGGTAPEHPDDAIELPTQRTSKEETNT